MIARRYKEIATDVYAPIVYTLRAHSTVYAFNVYAC